MSPAPVVEDYWSLLAAVVVCGTKVPAGRHYLSFADFVASRVGKFIMNCPIYSFHSNAMMQKASKEQYRTRLARILQPTSQPCRVGKFGFRPGPCMPRAACNQFRSGSIFLWRIRPAVHSPYSMLLDVLLAPQMDG